MSAAAQADDPRLADLEQALRASEGRRLAAERTIAQLVALLDAAPVLLFGTDLEGTIVMAEGGRFAPPAFRPAAIRGRSIFELLSVFPGVAERLRRALAGSDEEATVRLDDRTFALRVRSIRDGARVIGVSGAAVDITERLRDSERLAEAAVHDPLTGLPNQTLLRDRIRQGIPMAQRHGRRLGVAVLDLDAFHEVNDAFGREIGDAVLKEVAARFGDAVGEQATLARLDGDRFALVLPDVVDARGATRVAARLRAALATPIKVAGSELVLEASCGIAMAPDHGEDPDTLLRCAERALARAVLTGGCAIYLPEQERGAPPLPGDLRRGIEAGELTLSFRPTFEIESGRLVGAEGLVRWKHPRRGLLPASQFVPVAEKAGLIGAITSWALREAARVCAAWRAAGLDIVFTVTVAGRDLADGRLPEMARAAAEASHVPLDRLALQVPRAAAERPDGLAALRELREMGIRISVDRIALDAPEIGLKLPFDGAKIDRTSVAALLTDPGEAARVRSAIAAGHAAGLTVVAAGVETADALRRLAEMGCDRAQGDLLAPALTSDDFIAWARQQEGEAPRLDPAVTSVRPPHHARIHEVTA